MAEAKTVTARVNPELVEFLDEYADERNLTRSTVLERLIRDFYNSDGQLDFGEMSEEEIERLKSDYSTKWAPRRNSDRDETFIAFRSDEALARALKAVFEYRRA